MVRSQVTDNRTLSVATVNLRSRARYGCNTELIYRLWHELIDSNLLPKEGCKEGTVFNLLWALEYLKCYGTIAKSATVYKVSDVTFIKWVWLLVEAIARMSHLVSTG